MKKPPPSRWLTATGYLSPSSDKPADIVDSSVSFAAGAIYTTVGDLHKWDRALYRLPVRAKRHYLPKKKISSS